MIIFDGNQAAQAKEAQLKTRVAALREQNIHLKIAAILFTEDSGSVLYTRLKQEAAERVGMIYEVYTHSMADDIAPVQAEIEALNQDPTVTGIIIQKPGKARWLELAGAEKSNEDFQAWWTSLVSRLDEKKDVDGLHPATLAAVENNTWKQEKKVLPATAKAVLEILRQSQQLAPDRKVIILGKSDILGKPLFYEFKNQGFQVEMIGSKELNQRIEQKKYLLDADIIVSATGRQGLIIGDLVKNGVVVVDVGEPKPDVDFATVAPKASFITPVPGGVGPITVISLLENCVELIES
ncbi:MAG TPA: tetrahydrofolate dehydrogenase/cyclohydrolase catalytic domain-containing protein [Vitreimonas sp.]|nr:tetrahydrofolate dehydrogenase/cyclohydrolase catalytic domain-containing protein [Vitreimonas sp.]